MALDTPEKRILDTLAKAQTFHPSGAKLFVPDWTLDPGDVVTVQSDGESYDVPIYSLDLSWNGVCRADIQSTGNQQREPLSALRRKEYQAGRRGYGQFKEIDDEFKEFETWQTQTDEVIGTYAAQFVDILGDGTNEGRLTLAETAIEQTASDATITAQAAGILLDADGHPILDARGKYQYDPNAADTTLIAQINTNATEILAKVSRSDLNTTLASYLQINAFSTELASTLDNGDTTLAAKIITAVNKNTNTSSVVISANQINLVGVVNSTEMDTRLLKADALFSQTGWSGSIAVGTSVTAGSVIADTYYFKDSPNNEQIHSRPVQLLQSGYLANISVLAIGTAGTFNLTHYHDIDIEEVTSGANAGKMKVTIGHAVATSDTANHVDYFKIADTTAYRNGVASAKLQVGLNAMGYTEIQGTNYPSSQTIFTDTTGRTDASGADANLHRDITLSLDVDDNYVYMKHGSDIIARINNTGGGGGGGSYYATFLNNITLESTDIGDSVTKYSVANYSDGHRDSAANTRVVIDASKVYSAGVTAGLGGVVNVVKGSWSAGRCDFDPSAGTGQSQRVNLSYSIVKPGFYSSTDETTINVLDSSSSVGLPLNLVICRRQFGLYNYACLFKDGDSLTQGNVLAKFSIDGSAVISDVASILQNGRITYQDTDKKIANIPVTAYDDEDNALLSTTITANMSDTWDAGYETGYTQGSGVSILDQYSTTIDSNNTTITLLPSDKGNYNVMASANVRVQVPVHEGIQGATLLASTDSDSAWSGWQLNDYTTLSKKYGFIRITGNDGSTYSYGIDANGVFDAGVSAGSGVQIETSKSYGSTVTETGTYTINPSSGYDAMRRATFSVRVPTVPRIQSTLAYGTASMGSHTVYPDEDYDAMQRVTFTVPNVTVETQRNQPTTGVTTTNIKVGNNIKVIVKFGNATVHQQIFAATT